MANSLDTPVALRVDIVDTFEIKGLLEDEEDSYGAEAFECDENNQRIGNPTFKTQGARIRVCVQPDSFTQGYGVAMKSINQFAFTRGDVSQDIIIPDGVIQDLMITTYRCTPGEVICFFETEVSNRFYYSRGTVSATGTAWLQYAGSRRNRRRGLIEVPFFIGGAPSVDMETSLDLANPLLWNSRRRMVQAGGFIGARPVSLSFEVEPSGTDWGAVAFLCAGDNKPLVGNALTRTRNKDDDIRVCFMPNDDARAAGVYVRQISSFFFEQAAEEKIQFAVEPSKKPVNRTVFICNAGEPLCALKTELSEDFFDKNLEVVGKGEVLLQYGTDPRIPATTDNRRRSLQDQTDPTVDAGFAGRADVQISFRTDPFYIPPAELTWQEKADQWWHETPLFLRIVYVMAAVIGILILLCFLWAICCGNPFASKKKEVATTKKRKLFVQPVFVRNRNGGNGDQGYDNNNNAAGEDGPGDQERDMSKDWEVAQDDPVSASRRLENGPMEPVPESESYHFNGQDSIKAIEPDYSMQPPKSPKRTSSKRSSTSSKSPKPRKSKTASEGEGPSPKSPKRKTKTFDDSFASTGSASGRTSTSKSPKPRRSKRADSIQSPTPSDIQSPLPRRGTSVTGASPRKSTRASSTAGGSARTPKSAKPKRHTMDGSERSTGSSKRTPGSSKRSSTGSAKPKKKLPEVPDL